jgi:hypothetical protein
MNVDLQVHGQAFRDLTLLVQEEKVGMEVGFIRRKPRKIHPLQLLKAFCMLLPKSCPSLRALATVLSVLSSEAVSKQAVAQRIGKSWVEFLQQILALVLCRQLETDKTEPIFAQFHRVLLHDSSILPLPRTLASSYPGSTNQHGHTHAQAKVQAVLDIKHRSYVHFALTPYTRNDQTAAADVLGLVQPGDLIIRDLGYFVLKILKRIADTGAFFISRSRYGCSFYDLDGASIDLPRVLKKEGRVDCWVRIGSPEKLRARLVAIPLPVDVAEKRRRVLRQNRDRRLNPGKEHLFLLGWAIFITNVPEEVWSATQIAEIYGLRWRIEIIFKAWKSHFGIAAYSYSASRYQIESLIYARLISILLFQTIVYTPLLTRIDRRFGRKLSLLKFSAFVTHYHWLIPLIAQSAHKRLLDDILVRFCTYDKRKRLNYETLMENASWCDGKKLS